MLITKYVEKNIVQHKSKRYRELGYKLPDKIPQKGIKIKIKVEDLSDGCSEYVEYECDNCHKVFSTRYNVYKSRVKNDKKYYCSSCGAKIFNSGENHYNWNDSLTDKDRTKRRLDKNSQEWSKKVLKRDNYTCQKCKRKNLILHAHHLDGWNWCKNRRYDVTNGITLCSECHHNFHAIYGNGDNTFQQFVEWFNEPLEEILDYDGSIIEARKIICLETKEVKTCKDFQSKKNSSIYNVCNGKSMQYKGQHYMWYDDFLKSTQEHIDYIMSLTKDNNAIKVVCIEKKLLFSSCVDGELYFGKNSCTLSTVLKDKKKTFSGCHWCKIEEYLGDINELTKISHKRCEEMNKIIMQGKKIVCVENKLVFNTYTDAAKYFNIKTFSRIGVVIDNDKRIAYGFHWCHLCNYKNNIQELTYINNIERSKP